MRRLRRYRAHHRAPAKDIGRGLPDYLLREQDAHLEYRLQAYLFLGTKEDTGAADVQCRPFAPCRFSACPVAQGRPDGETFGTRLVTHMLLPWIISQARPRFRILQDGRQALAPLWKLRLATPHYHEKKRTAMARRWGENLARECRPSHQASWNHALSMNRSSGQTLDASRCCIASNANSRRFVTPTFSNMLVR